MSTHYDSQPKMTIALGISDNGDGIWTDQVFLHLLPF